MRPRGDIKNVARGNCLEETIVISAIVASIYMVFFGIPNKIIDSKHRKRKAYEPGHEWSYYAKLSKEGNWQGRFVMWSSYLGIGVALAVIVEMFYVLSR